VPNTSVVFGGLESNRTVTILPATNQFGTATITITVSDGQIDVSTTFNLTINPINHPPTLDPLPDLVVARNSSPRIVHLTGITARPENELQNLTITAVSSNPDLIPFPTVTYSSPDPSGTLMLAPLTDAVGSSVITVTVRDDTGTFDGGQDRTSQAFNVTVFSPPVLEIAQEDGTLRLSFETVLGKTYLIEYVDALGQTNWTPVDAIPGTGASVTVPVSVLTAPCRFYHVRIE